MKVEVGDATLELPSAELDYLRESNDVLHDAAALRRRLNDEGYLFLRGFHPREEVLEARRAVLEFMRENGAALPEGEVMDGIVNPDYNGGGDFTNMGKLPIADHPAIKSVLGGARMHELFERIFGTPSATFNFRWVRAVGPEKNTGIHYDWVYMGRGSQQLHSVWTPLGDISIDLGTLLVAEGSHNGENYRKLRDTYGQWDVDNEMILGAKGGFPGWLSQNPREISETFGGRWLTANFEAGDVLLFGLYLLHTSSNNNTNRFRVSADTRFQPANEPLDPRWDGEIPDGNLEAVDNFLNHRDEMVPVEQVRVERWGV